MFRRNNQVLLGLTLLISISTASGFSQCNCEDEGFWSLETVLHCQRVSDTLIALSYLSISLELLYFVTCSGVFPFRWVLFLFGAFIVLCGLTHFVNAYTSHSFYLMLTLTVLKFLTALVSCATAITLVTLIPQLLRVKVKERFLKNKTRELDRAVDLMNKQKEASRHVRMLTREIRKSLDRHTILYTTLIELSEMLFLENCAIWMPDQQRIDMNLTHELKQRDVRVSIPITYPDVVQIKGRKCAMVLSSDSCLGRASSHAVDEFGAAAAIRMPMLRVSNFKGGTPDLVEACYAILVLVFPSDGCRVWSCQELEIVEVVADQVAVALSHAALLEESQLMREKLMEQNVALIRAREKVLMATEARSYFRKKMSHEMRIPVRSIMAVVSILQIEILTFKQKKIVDVIAKFVDLLSDLINDVTGISNLEEDGLALEPHPFDLYSMLTEFGCISKLLCACKGICFDLRVSGDVPSCVVGDAKRIIQVLLHMVCNVLSFGKRGSIVFRVCSGDRSQGEFYPKCLQREQAMLEEFTLLRFELRRSKSNADVSGFSAQEDQKCCQQASEQGLGFTICKRLAQFMNGEIWITPSSQNLHGTMIMSFIIRLKRQTFKESLPRYMGHETVKYLLNGSKVLIAEGEGFNLSVSRKLLEKLGCQVAVAFSWDECLNTLLHDIKEFQLLLIDLDIFEEDACKTITRVRKLRSRNWLLIIAMASILDRGTRDRCLKNEMDGVVSKPIILEEMRDELKKAPRESPVHYYPSHFMS